MHILYYKFDKTIYKKNHKQIMLIKMNIISNLLMFVLFSTNIFVFAGNWLGTAPVCGYSSSSRDRCGDSIASEFGNPCLYGKKIYC